MQRNGFPDEAPKIWAMVSHTLVDAIKRKGRDPAAVLDRFGLTEVTLRDPYNEIPLHSYISAFEAAAIHVGDDMFGLYAARDVSPYVLGPIGLLFANSPSLGAAMKGLIDYIWLAQQGAVTKMTREGDDCVFQYRIFDNSIKNRRQDAEFSIVLLVNLIRNLVGSTWRPVEVYFEHAEPADARALALFFRAPIYFDQPSNGLLFPASDLVAVGAPSDRRISPIVQHYLNILNDRKSHHRSLGDEIRRLISDQGGGDGRIDIERAAKSMGVSARTLHRNLKEAGEGFRAIKQDKQRALAENYLAGSKLSMTEIAHIMGYADAACFTRACRRWFGMTPSAFRRQVRGSVPTQS